MVDGAEFRRLRELLDTDQQQETWELAQRLLQAQPRNALLWEAAARSAPDPESALDCWRKAFEFSREREQAARYLTMVKRLKALVDMGAGQGDSELPEPTFPVQAALSPLPASAAAAPERPPDIAASPTAGSDAAAPERLPETAVPPTAGSDAAALHSPPSTTFKWKARRRGSAGGWTLGQSAGVTMAVIGIGSMALPLIGRQFILFIPLALLARATGIPEIAFSVALIIAGGLLMSQDQR